jgi:hypothetical protein
MMKRRGLVRSLVLVAAFAALPALAFALDEGAPVVQEQSLLTPDGTLYVIRTGRAVDLSVEGVNPDSYLIECTTLAQDGSLTSEILPDSISAQEKHGLQLGFDEQTGTLLTVWTEDVSAFSHIRVGVFHDGTWTNSPLLTKQGIAKAYNPKMQITHQQVSYVDQHDHTISKTSSILSVVWWEEGQGLQARMATLFLDESGFDPANLAIYDVPALTGGQAATVYNDVPEGAYLYPSLQPDGLNGAVLVSYADLHANVERVLRISFPDDQGRPSDPGSLKWQRRHIPIVGVAGDGPIPTKFPDMKDKNLVVGTTIGAGYRPTYYWRAADSLKYTRLENGDWSDVRAIAINETTTYEKALALVAAMAGRN